MGLFDFIGGIFAPATKLIDDIHVSDEERLQLRNELAKIQAGAMEKLTELEKARLNAMSKVQAAEANSKHTITATWRPITSMVLVALIVAGSFGMVTVGPEIYDLAEIFLGAYAGGRSLEKVSSALKLGKS